MQVWLRRWLENVEILLSYPIESKNELNTFRIFSWTRLPFFVPSFVMNGCEWVVFNQISQGYMELTDQWTKVDRMRKTFIEFQAISGLWHFNSIMNHLRVNETIINQLIAINFISSFSFSSMIIYPHSKWSKKNDNWKICSASFRLLLESN